MKDTYTTKFIKHKPSKIEDDSEVSKRKSRIQAAADNLRLTIKQKKKKKINIKYVNKAENLDIRRQKKVK